MEHPGTKRLETERLLLRPFGPADAESCIRNWAADPVVYRYISQEPQTPEQCGAGLPRRRKPMPARRLGIGRSLRELVGK